MAENWSNLYRQLSPGWGGGEEILPCMGYKVCVAPKGRVRGFSRFGQQISNRVCILHSVTGHEIGKILKRVRFWEAGRTPHPIFLGVSPYRPAPVSWILDG